MTKEYSVKKVAGFDPFEHLTKITNTNGETILAENGDPKMVVTVAAQRTWFEMFAAEKGCIPAIHTERRHNKFGDYEFIARVYLDYKDAAMATEFAPNAGSIGTGSALVANIDSSKYDPFATAQTKAVGYALKNAGFGPEIAMALSDGEETDAAAAPAPQPKGDEAVEAVIAKAEEAEQKAKPKAKAKKKAKADEAPEPEAEEHVEAESAAEPEAVEADPEAKPEKAETETVEAEKAETEEGTTEEALPEAKEDVMEVVAEIVAANDEPEAAEEEPEEDEDDEEEEHTKAFLQTLYASGTKVPEGYVSPVEQATEEPAEGEVQAEAADAGTSDPSQYVITEEDAAGAQVLEAKIGQTLDSLGVDLCQTVLERLSENLTESLRDALEAYIAA